jgi:P-type Cu+ transporter
LTLVLGCAIGLLAQNEGLNKKVKDPVCGMEVDPDGPTPFKIEQGGQTYYFCNAACKSKFRDNPGKYINGKTADEPKIPKDPVCGMAVDPKASSLVKSEYKGRTYYFCGENCKKSFKADPEKYVRKGMAAPDMSTAQPAR